MGGNGPKCTAKSLPRVAAGQGEGRLAQAGGRPSEEITLDHLKLLENLVSVASFSRCYIPPPNASIHDNW